MSAEAKAKVGPPGPREGGSRRRTWEKGETSDESALSMHRSGLVVFRVSLKGIPSADQTERRGDGIAEVRKR